MDAGPQCPALSQNRPFASGQFNVRFALIAVIQAIGSGLIATNEPKALPG